MSRQQRTISLEAEIEGKGLFTGQSVHLRLRPAEPDTGLVFRRVDLGEEATIAATIEAVAKRFQRTTLANGEVCVETAEHLLAALTGLGIDNLVAEIDGPELPGGDGSASDYVRLLRQAGIVEQEKERPVLAIAEPVTVQDGEAIITALPGPEGELTVTFHLDYGPGGVIPPQIFSTRLTPEAFVEELATTRTYILESEVEDLRQRGYGPHATYDDLLVIGPGGPVNNTYRFPDEPARHKILDLLGDLFLLNADLEGRVVAMQSGHALNHRLIRRLLEQAAQTGEAHPAARRQAMDVNQIMEVLPHRYPFLLIDRILSLEDNVRAVGIKNVSINEHYFQGHYPGTPIMPGVLIVEAMAQLSGVVLLRKLEHTGQVAVLLSMDKVKLRKTVHPGDQLRLEAEVAHAQPRRAQVNTRAWVGDELAAEAKIRFMLVPADQEL
ncbi:MAG: UDP-3-O-[3-hydroxymyristoyl] N-acetylglucosamine deacetylase [Planctomycetes bacterium]|nr:UDP-3-O-[3-hydroxymyristoyl] N-acetylglucosamine deacetylase [Planctomycetota bacterium]